MAATMGQNLSDNTTSTHAFPTPGPVSAGDPGEVAKQRASLGLTPDPTGESDTEWDPEIVASIRDAAATIEAAAATELLAADGQPVSVPVSDAAAADAVPQPVKPAEPAADVAEPAAVADTPPVK